MPSVIRDPSQTDLLVVPPVCAPPDTAALRYQATYAFLESRGADSDGAGDVNAGSMLERRKPDETFGICDIEFENPEIAVLTLSLGDKFGKFGWIIRILLP